jgi:hypothetical protein
LWLLGSPAVLVLVPCGSNSPQAVLKEFPSLFYRKRPKTPPLPDIVPYAFKAHGQSMEIEYVRS